MNTLDQASEALEAGNSAEARRVLEELLQNDPDNAEVWEMLFLVLDNPIEKCDCLKQVVRLCPNDLRARQKLKKYKAGLEYRSAKASHTLEKMEYDDKAKEARTRKKRLANVSSSVQDSAEIVIARSYSRTQSWSYLVKIIDTIAKFISTKSREMIVRKRRKRNERRSHPHRRKRKENAGADP